jgi:transcriptional regulator with XRE-family HTH domain
MIMPQTTEAPNPIDVYVGSRLRAERMAKGWSQSDLAKALNLSFQQVQKYERGTNRLSASTLLTACQALGVKVADLFPGDEDGVSVAGRPQIEAVRGGSELAGYYTTMPSRKRQLLLQIAATFSGDGETTDRV